MPKDKNLQLVADLKNKVKKARSITFVDYLGLDVNKLNNFRSKVSENKADTVVAKNTLFKKALAEEKYDLDKSEGMLKGPTAAIFAYDDPISPLKTIFDFAKNFELPKVKFSYLDRSFTNAEQVKTLSELPSKEVILTRILSNLKSPITGFVNVLGGTRRQFVTVLSKISEKKN